MLNIERDDKGWQQVFSLHRRRSYLNANTSKGAAGGPHKCG